MANQKTQKQNQIIEDILFIENYCNQHRLGHRFVGGTSSGGILNSKTTWEIDIPNKTIYFSNATIPESFRSDGTEKDIDLILLSHIRRYANIIPERKTPVTAEPAIYYPDVINEASQFVTDLYVDEKNKPYLVFEKVKEKTSWESWEPWTIQLAPDIRYTVRNPIADYFAYQFRSPAGPKPKDFDKIARLRKLVEDIIKEGKRHNIKYMSKKYYGPWQKYTKKLQSSTYPSTSTKRIIMKLYWMTIGETLAHGKGLAKIFTSLHNKFTG